MPSLCPLTTRISVPTSGYAGESTQNATLIRARMDTYIARVETLRSSMTATRPAPVVPGAAPSDAQSCAPGTGAVPPSRSAASGSSGIGSSQFMQKGIAKIKQATEIDTQVTQSGSMGLGRYDAAVTHYIKGIEYFNHALKCESTRSQPSAAKMWRGVTCGGLGSMRPRSDSP